MHICTLLNHVFKHKGFVYDHAELNREADELVITIRPDRRCRARCRHCGREASTYDHRPPRRFSMIPLWTLAVVFVYAMRRVDCRHCGRVVTEQVPWSIGGKSWLTTAFAHHLAGWARHLSWKEVARRCGTSWDSVARSIEWLVDWGLAHRSLDGIEAIGVDEIQTDKGHHYATLVYQLDPDNRRLLWMGKERTMDSFNRFFDMLGRARCATITVVCSDMWKAYLTVIARRLPHAINILDRFHIVKKLNEAVDQTRRDEAGRLRSEGKPATLKKTRWIWLKRKGNLTRDQHITLRELLRANLTTVKAYLFKEAFDRLWSYTSPSWAGRFIDNWCRDVMHHKSLPRLKTFVGTIRKHRELILNYFRAKSALNQTFSSGMVEGFNNKVKLTLRKSYGFRSEKYREAALFHALGALPEPSSTHRFG